MPRTRSTKFTKEEEEGGKKAAELPARKVVGDATTEPTGTQAKRRARAVALKSPDRRVREDKDFYRICRGPTKPVEQRTEVRTVQPETQGTETKPENRIAKAVVETAFQVHTALGPGLLESVYEIVMAHELRALGFRVQQQVPIAIRYKDITFEKAFLADLLVDGMVIVELKSVDQLAPIHAKQLLTQVRLMQKRLGLLINFGSIHLKDNIRRLANGLETPSKSVLRSL